MSYKAVLFDMDGTLLDTLEDLRDSTNHVLRQMGYPERSLEEMRRFVGNGAEKQIRRAVPEGTSEEKIMETLAAYRAYYQDHCQIKTRVYDGLLNMLSELKAKGIKLAVVSNKPDSAVQKLSREYFGDRMDFAVGPSDGVRCKPYPDMAETALKALGIAKKDAVFVGDSEVDVQTGLNAGLDVIAVSWGFRSREVVIEAGGIYSGLLTATESSAIAVVWSFIAGMFIYRELKWSDLFDIFVDSAKSSAMTLFIIATSTAFAWLFAYAGISTQLVDFVVGMHLSATMYCLVVAVILLIFGTFLEGIATAVLLVPVLWPVAQALGVNVIHFGMIVSIANVVGTMTPPVAVNIFSAASVTKLSMGKIVHGQWPFFIGYVGFFFLVVFIPALSTFLL